MSVSADDVGRVEARLAFVHAILWLEVLLSSEIGFKSQRDSYSFDNNQA